MKRHALFLGLLAALNLPLAHEAQALGEADEAPVSQGPSAELEKALSVPPPGPEATPREVCVYRHKRGVALLRLGRYDDALDELKQALALNQPAGADQWCERWRVQGDIRATLYSQGDWLETLRFAQAAGSEYKDSNPWRYFSTLIWRIDAYVPLGNLRGADKAFQEAGELLPTLRTQKNWAIYGNNALDRYSTYGAWLQELRGNYRESEKLRREALNYATTYVATLQASRSPDNIDLRVARDNLTGRKRGLAGILATQGKLGEAEVLARQALQETLSRSSRNTLSAARAIAMLSTIRLQQGMVADALQLREESLAALEGASVKPYSTLLADMRAQKGFLLEAQGRWKEALQTFELRDQGLRSNPEQFRKTGSRHANWAVALLMNGRQQDAEIMLRGMIDWNLKKPFVDPAYLAALRGYLGLVQLKGGDVEGALRSFRESFPVLVRQAETDNTSESGGFVRSYRLRLIADGYLEALARLYRENRLLPREESIDEAFQIADSARTSRVQQAIANSVARANLPDAALADLARREQDASNRITVLNNQLTKLAAANDNAVADSNFVDISQELRRLDQERESLQKQLRERFPGYAELALPKPPSLLQVQQVLAPDEAVVALYAGESQTYVWTITPSTTAFRAVPLGLSQVRALVDRLKGSVALTGPDLPAFDLEAARHLYDELLRPDAGLWESAKVLNVVTHGPLGQVPLGLLLTGPAQGRKLTEQPWLIRQLAVAEQPSATTLVALRAARPGAGERLPFVGFGDPVFGTGGPAPAATTRGLRSLRPLALRSAGPSTASPNSERTTARDAAGATLTAIFGLLPALPDTREELQNIGSALGVDTQRDLFLGPQASEGNVKRANLGRYRIVDFATHGLIPGDIPGLDEPALALANPSLADDSANDGLLTLSEVLGLKLQADWVVLSACNTASGDGRNEEAVSGLGRAFFFAGTHRLLVSYWPVETTSARLLTTELFRQQLRFPERPKAEHLRQSMLTLMARPEYAHPLFWAPFGIIGDAGP